MSTAGARKASCSPKSQAASLITVPRRSLRLLLALVVVVAAALRGGTAHAYDRVTLRNGFSYDCARQQAIDPTHTRLFLSPDTKSSYIDIPTTDIVAVDAVPAPLPSTTSSAPLAEEKSAAASADVHTLLATAGSVHNIDMELLASIVHAESGGHAHAVSHVGAGGLMQLMPGTAHDLGVHDVFRPEDNINGGTAYLDALLKRYHDNLALALAAYNAGPSAVDRYHGIPPFHETRAYVVRVMTEFKRRKEALQHPPAADLRASR